MIVGIVQSVFLLVCPPILRSLVRFSLLSPPVTGLLLRLLDPRYAEGGLNSFLFLHEGIGDFFAAVDGRDNDEEGATSNDEAELAVTDVTFVVCKTLSRVMRPVLIICLPVIASLTSSRTRFISWS
jgi:hypothetical protein